MVCNPHSPDVSLQLPKALFLCVLVQELPFSYRAPGSQVTGLGRGRWRQWLSCVLPHLHSSWADCATQMSFGLWLLSLIFFSPTGADPWKIKDTPLSGSYFPNEPRAAATVLPASSGGPGATSAQRTYFTHCPGLCWNCNCHLFPSH